MAEKLRVTMEVIDHTTRVLNKISKGLDALDRKYRKLERSTRKTSAVQRDNTKAVMETSESINDLIGRVGALVVAYKGLEATKAALNASDEFISAEARIGLITDDPSGMMDQVYQLSQETRSNFMEMAGVVSKMGINVGVGEGEWFGDTDELLKFNELLTKTFKLGGQNNKEVNAAMLQLTQAMSSGRLQGDEFRSMFENSPLYIKYIGEYLGHLYGAVDETGKSIALTTGQLKELAAESLITTDIMIDAMFYASDEIEKKFETLPRTFEQRWEQMKNMLLQQSRSMLTSLNSIVDNESFDTFLNHLSNQITTITNALTTILDILSPVIQFVLRHWNIIGPLMLAAITYLGVLIVKTEIMANQWLKTELAARKYLFTQNRIAVNGAIANAIHQLVVIFKAYNLALTQNNKYGLMVLKTKYSLALQSKILAFVTKHETIVTSINTVITYLNIIAKKLHIGVTLQQVTAQTLAAKATNLLSKAMLRVVWPIALVLGVTWLVIKGFNALTGSSYTLAQFLAGTLGVVFVGLYNTLVPLYNLLVDTANAMDRIAGGTGDKYIRAEYKTMEEGLAWGDKYANKSVIDYGISDFGANDVLSDDLKNGIDKIIGNTGETAKNTAMSSTDVAFLRAMAENRVSTRIANTEITINNNNAITANDSRDLTGLVDQLTKQLEESIANSAAGVHT